MTANMTAAMIVPKLVRLLAVPCLALALSATVPVHRAGAQETDVRLDVPFVPTPHDVVASMLRMADAKPGDILYDLGSGDGRIVISAVRDFGVAKGVGVDIDPARVAEATANAAAAGVTDKVTFVQGDVFDFDFSEATVVTMYLLDHINQKLRPKVLALKPGTRVVSHQFTMGDWEPDAAISNDYVEIYFWTVPARVAGSWRWGDYRLDLHQEFQKVSGGLQEGETRTRIDRISLQGDRLRFEASLNGQRIAFDGRVSGDVIEATVNGRKTTVRRIM